MRLNAVKLHSVQSNNAKFSPAKNSAPKAQAAQNPLKELSSIPTNKVLAQMGNISFGKYPNISDEVEEVMKTGKELYEEMNDNGVGFEKSAINLWNYRRQLASYEAREDKSEELLNNIEELRLKACDEKKKMMYYYMMIPSMYQKRAYANSFMRALRGENKQLVEGLTPETDKKIAEKILEEVQEESDFPRYNELISPIKVEDDELQERINTYVDEVNRLWNGDWYDRVQLDAIKKCIQIAKICKLQGKIDEVEKIEYIIKQYRNSINTSLEPNRSRYVAVVDDNIAEYDPEFAKEFEQLPFLYYPLATGLYHACGSFDEAQKKIEHINYSLKNSYEKGDYLDALDWQLGAFTWWLNNYNKYDTGLFSLTRAKTTMKDIFGKLPKDQKQQALDLINECRE